jgi:hypothetical protein
MSFFAPQTKRITIVGPSGDNYVTVRKLTYGERQKVMSEAMVIDVKGGRADDTNVTIDAAKMQELQLVAAIVSWEGADFDRPLSRANVLDLPFEVAAEITAGIEELNEPAPDDEKKG